MRSHRNLLLVTVLSAVHAAGLVLTLEDPAALFDGRPILDQDWGLHFHHLTSLAGFRESGRLWGYNPYFMAGYPSNTFQDLSISGRLFGRDVATFDDRELREYLRLYNVAWVVAFDPRTVARLRRLGGLVEPVANAGGIVMARVHQPRSWFVRGNGRVRVGYDRIECSEVEGSEVMLKYHWVAGLVSDPPLAIEPVHLLDDPIPFLRIVDPPERFTLSIGRRPRL